MTDIDIITLAHETPLWRGAFRAVYTHPKDPRKLIKVMHEEGRERSISRRRVWRKSGRLNGNQREMTTIGALHAVNAYDLNFFPEFFGPTETDQGEGLVFENLQYEGQCRVYRPNEDADRRDLLEHFSIERLLTLYDDMAQLFLGSGIISTALNIENIALIKTNQSVWSLKTFDLKVVEDLRLIPISKFSKLERKRRTFSYYRSMRKKIARSLASPV